MIRSILKNTRFRNVLTSIVFLTFGTYAHAFQSDNLLVVMQELGDCGQFRTQTQGGWGSGAAGNNPGSYRDANFEDAFPNGLSIGCDYTLTLTSSQAVEDFLPSGATASILTQNLIDPESYSNVLAAQLIALRLSIGFDENDSEFSPSDVNLGDMVIGSGDFMGWTVYELIDETNLYIGSCTSSYSATELNETLTAINENYVDGVMDGGFLDCPEEQDNSGELTCSLELDNVTSYCNEDDTYSLEITISGSNATYIVNDANALTGNGGTTCLSDTTTENVYTFVLTYGTSSNYSVTVSTLSPSLEGCTEPTNPEECFLDAIEGTPPVCCEFVVDCPTIGQFIFSCIAEIPDADTSLISYVNNCGPVTIDVTESYYGQGCTANPYYLTRVYTVNDGSTTIECSYDYIAIDGSPPVITCPEDEYAECSLGELAPQNWATATDNCDTNIDISYVDLMEGSCDSFTRVWTATDDCGNAASCNQTVYITDTTPPNLIIPADTTIDCGSELLPSQTGTASANDVCSEVSLTYEDGVWNGNDCTAWFIRTWTATDACGNSVSGEQTINKEDNAGPVIYGVPGGAYLQCGEIPIAPSLVAFDECQNDSVEVILTETIYGEGCQMAIFRTWSATDSCGNTSSVTRAIYINDTQGPIITCPDSVQLNCGDLVPDPEEAGFASAFDECSGDSVTISFIDGPLNNDCPPSIHRIWTAVDSCGNASSCVQVISFIDTEAPVVECVDDVTVNCSYGDTSPLFTGTPNVLGDCSNIDLDYTDGAYSGDCPINFTRTWTATDACGNTSVCEQIITVIDEAGPALFTPSDITIDCGESTAPEQTGMAAAFDNCLSVSLTYQDGDVSGVCIQSFTRTWIATDYCGNQTFGEQVINIEDNVAPVLSCPEPLTVDCNTSDMDTEIGTATAIDDCGSDVLISYMDTPLEGSCPQFFYRVWIATDACGNSSQCSQMVTIIDETAPEITCPIDITVSCEDSVEPEFTGFATASDDCSLYEITYTDSLVMNGEGSTGSENCGQFRTQTQGGWGSAASGNNPGTYRDLNFDNAFPDGLTIGCDLTLKLSTSLDVENFLPAGGTSAPLMIDMLNPVGYGNTLAAQLVATTLSLGFDNYDPDFSEADMLLSNLIISGGALSGFTVAEVVYEANQFIGQCESDYSASELNDVLSRINENYVDGTMDGGFLLCDEETTNCFSIYRTWFAEDECGNVSACTQVITAVDGYVNPEGLFDATTNKLIAYPSPTDGEVNVTSEYPMEIGDLIEIIDLSGVILASFKLSDDGTQNIDLSNLESGIYVIHWIGKAGTGSIRVVKN